jgi:uncharacterized protein (TIGR04255 family)
MDVLIFRILIHVSAPVNGLASRGGGGYLSMSASIRSADLPDFDEPPVVETVLSVQFEPLTEMRTAHLGLLWEKFRVDFPKTEERPPLDRVFEQFPEAPRSRLGLELQTYENPPVPRLCFITAQGNEMIQVQPDRFIKNWRKEGEGETYPRYERNKASFERDFVAFQEFVAVNRLGTPRVNQCEVTYLNHILSDRELDSFGDVDRVFTFWKSLVDRIPGDPEDLRVHARFVIPGYDGTPVGRLHAEIQPAFRASDRKTMYVFSLTARGQVGESFEFFDLGRRWIVKSFAALTTPRMHEVWRRKG